MAIVNRAVESAEVLFEYGATATEEQKDGRNLLHLACRSQSKRTVELVLRKGANVSVAPSPSNALTFASSEPARTSSM